MQTAVRFETGEHYKFFERILVCANESKLLAEPEIPDARPCIILVRRSFVVPVSLERFQRTDHVASVGEIDNFH